MMSRTFRHARPYRLTSRGRHWTRRLVSESLERRMLLTTITAVDPAANSHNAAASAEISATFDADVVAGTATADNFVVHGSISRGQLIGSGTMVTAAGPVITHNPSSDFAAGELVQVTATSGISTTGGAANKRVWQFRTAAVGSGELADSGQELLSVAAQYVSLGDIDGDGDADAVLGASGAVALNDGTGTFSDSGQRLTAGGDLELGDIDGDGDLDVIGTGEVWTNNGSGIFTDTNQSFGGNTSTIAVGDIDGDGDLDAMVGVAYTSNRVFFNNGSGSFTNSGQNNLGTASVSSIEFADLDGDGDLDAFAANNGPADQVFFNDGAGIFTDSGQAIGGFQASTDMELGDLDGDGDADAFIVTESGANRIWLNDGDGVFVPGESVGNHRTFGIALGDFDGDGDLDAFESNSWALNIAQQDSRVWINDGSASFSDSGQRFAPFFNYFSAIADLDGDGDLDVFMASNSQPSRVLLNQNLTPNVSLSVDNESIVEAGGTASITATLSAAHTTPVTIELAVSGTATATDDYTLSATQLVIAAGETSGSVSLAAVQDSVDEPDETVTVEIASITNGQGVGQQAVTVTIEDDDEPPVPDVRLTLDETQIAEAAGVATFAVVLSQTTTVPVVVELAFSGTADAADYTASSSEVTIGAGETSAAITVTAVQDELNEADETVIVEIVNVTGGNEEGEQRQTTTIIDDDAPPSFAVGTLTAMESGFRVEFSAPLDGENLNLYDTQNAGLGPADVVLVGATSGEIRGSLAIEPSAITFIKSGGPLAADTYQVRLRSADDGFKDTDGRLLDGDGDGTAGDDYAAEFVVAPTPDGARRISIPDFVRGPGQDANLPADTESGIPITISDGDNVRAADIRIAYDPARLEITGVTAPAGGTAILNTTTTPGVAILVFFSSASLPAGETTFINLSASVPTENSADNFGTQQVLDLHAVTIGDGNDNEFAVEVDDAVHVVSYFGDVSGNGRINASDAAQVARFAALIDSGFAGAPNADPVLVGDISGNGRINAADASRVAQFAALIDVPEIPPIPRGVALSGWVEQPQTPPSNLPGRESGGGSQELERGSDLELARQRVADAALSEWESSIEDQQPLPALEELLDELTSW